MKTRILWLLAATLASCQLAGCGGSGGGTKAGGGQTGAVRFQIQWPSATAHSQAKARPSLIPLDAKSIVITIKDGAAIISGPTVIPAPAAGAVATSTISNLPLKALTALVEAKADPAGQGAAETAASEMVTPTSGTPATAPTLVLKSQITNLTIATPPSGLTLFAGGMAFVSVTPTNAQGQVVMVDPNTKTIQWTVGPGLTFSPAGASTGLSVQLTATAVGTSTLSALYTDGSSATGDAVSISSNNGVSVPVAIQPAPTGGPPNVEAYVNRNGLAIGPSGVGPGKFQQLGDVALGSFYTADPNNTGFEVQKFTQNPDGTLGTPGQLPGGGPGRLPDPTFGGNGTVSVPGASSAAVDSHDDSVYVIGNASSPDFGSAIYKFGSDGTPVLKVGSSISPTALLYYIRNRNVQGAADLTVDFQGNLIVAETAGGAATGGGAAQVEVYDPNGAPLTSTPISTPGLQTGAPLGVTVDLSDNVYVLVGRTLVKLKPNTPGAPGSGYTQDAGFGTGGVTTPLASAADVAVDTRPGLVTTGNLYVTVPSSNLIEVFDKNGVDSGSLPISQSPAVNIGSPSGITIDNRVNVLTSGYIYVGNKAPAGTVSQAVQVLSPAQ